MNRTTTAVLVAAALVGTVGGTVTAVVRDDTRVASPGPSVSSPSVTTAANPSASPSARPTAASPSPTPSRTTPAPSTTPAAKPKTLPLLYAAKGVIHDGDKKIRYKVSVDRLERLVRTRDGYLIAYAIIEREPDKGLRLVAVAPDGKATKVAATRDMHFDLSADRARVVATERDTGRLAVWNLQGGVVARAPLQDHATETLPVFYGNTVLFSSRFIDDAYVSWFPKQWDLQTGAVEDVPQDFEGLAGMVGSADGSLLVGGVPNGSPVREDNEDYPCRMALSAPGAGAARWRTCDWEGDQLSADGTRLLAIASDTPVGGEADYSGATFAVFSATKGPLAGVTTIKAPTGTVRASWRGNDRVLFHTMSQGASDVPDNDSVLQECSLDGRCDVVARVDNAWAVVGDEF